jgi:hypothetical protein
MSEKQVIALLKKAQQLIALGLQVELTKKTQYNKVTGQAIRTLCNDLK